MTTYRTLRSLRDQGRGIKPDATWVRDTRKTLLMQVKNAMPTQEMALRSREPMLVTVVRRAADAVRGPALATLSILTVALGGSIASVSASEQSLPGDVLYPVKIVTEQARMAFASDKSNRVRLKSEFTKRRVDELKTIVTNDNPDKDKRVAKAADVLKSDLDTLRRQLSDVTETAEPADALEAAKIVDKNVVEVAKALSATKENLSVETQEKVDAAQAQAVDVGIQALEVLVASDGGVSEMELGESVAAHTEIAHKTVADARMIANVNASSTELTILIPVSGQTSSTKPVATSTTALQLVQDAEASLATLQGLVDGNQMDQVVFVLKNVTVKSLAVQQQSASSTPSALPAGAAATSTVLGTTTSSTPTSSTPQP